MTMQDQNARFILSAASGLYANGQQTEETSRAVAELGTYLNLPVRLIPRWGELVLSVGQSPTDLFLITDVAPLSVAMNRVVEIDRVIHDLTAETMSVANAKLALQKASRIPPLSIHLFAFACAAGATALGVTFGASHAASLILIFFSAGIGGYVRRLLGAHGVKTFGQTFIGGLIAGLIGAIGVDVGISSDLRLLAVCPCMVMVPGPYLLNGTLDLLAYRIPLGASRLAFAALTLAAISGGLLIGLALGAVDLPATAVARDVSAELVIVAAGVAAASYGVFFSMPPAMLGWPVVAGMVANGIRWAAMNLAGAGAVEGATIAAFVVGILLVPVAHYRRLPFAGIGFASVVSLMPGVLVFRMIGGFVALNGAKEQEVMTLLNAVVVDGTTAMLVVLGLTVGIVGPKHAFDVWRRREERSRLAV